MARLLDVLRTQLHLTGTKEGCGEGECGACAVMIDGALVNSCLVPRSRSRAPRRRRSKGWPPATACTAIQQAFIEHGGAQCGICTPGMVLAAAALLERNPEPDDGRHSRRPRRQPVPLHRLHADLRSGRRRRAMRPVGTVRSWLADYDMRRAASLDEALLLLVARTRASGRRLPAAPT